MEILERLSEREPLRTAKGGRPLTKMHVKDFCLAYRKRRAFSDVTVSFSEKRVSALIGPSGCGKTSFLMCLNRLIDLIPEARTSGSVHIESLNVYGPKVDLTALRRRIGLIFQKPNPFPLSIKKNLELPLLEMGMANSHERIHIIEAALKEVGLWQEVKGRLNSSALALSGGQQQRLCIARALVLKPEILLMDEPCSSLDPISSGVVEDLILRLKSHYTLLVVTHNLFQARRIADEVGLFWPFPETGGKLIEFGPARKIFEDPDDSLTKAYITGARG